MKLKIFVCIATTILIASCILPNATSVSIVESVSSDKEKCNLLSNGWQQINEGGFGSRYNRGPRGIAIFNDSLVIGTANYNSDTILEENKSWEIKEFRELYFKSLNPENIPSNGCEIWSYNGTNWTQLVGNTTDADSPSGFGNKNNSEVGFLITFKGYLYAGIRNHHNGAEIWRTQSINQSWELVLDEGGGNTNNLWFMIASEFKNELYVGTFNAAEGCEIFKTCNGVNWNKTVGLNADTENGFSISGNAYAWSMAVYDDLLYVGTANLNGGGELWKTKDGFSWDPVIAYDSFLEARLHGADYPRGFCGRNLFSWIRYMMLKPNFRGGIRDMAVYKNELYIGFVGEDLYVNIVIEKLGKVFTFGQGFPRVLYPLRRYLNRGLEIWKYNSTLDKWSRVVGGIGKGTFNGGFNDVKNEYPWDMKVYNGSLYIGTLNADHGNFTFTRNRLLNWNLSWATPEGNAELWRYDGSNLEQINNDGFNDRYNVGIRELIGYKNKIYAATMNLKTGCQVWEYEI